MVSRIMAFRPFSPIRGFPKNYSTNSPIVKTEKREGNAAEAKMQHFGLLLEGAVCPRGQTGEYAKLGVGICPLWVKASPGGEAGSPQGLTDEVEAINFYHGLVLRCYPRPHPSRAVARTTVVEE